MGLNASYDVEPVNLSGLPRVKLLKLDVKLYGRGTGDRGACWFSSTGKHVSTIASRQLTNNSEDSTIMLYFMEKDFGYEKKRNFVIILTFVNGPANRQSPPNPHDCKKWSGCCEASSDANIFWIMLCTAARTTWSFDDDKTLLIFWSRREWLWNKYSIRFWKYKFHIFLT